MRCYSYRCFGYLMMVFQIWVALMVKRTALLTRFVIYIFGFLILNFLRPLMFSSFHFCRALLFCILKQLLLLLLLLLFWNKMICRCLTLWQMMYYLVFFTHKYLLNNDTWWNNHFGFLFFCDVVNSFYNIQLNCSYFVESCYSMRAHHSH